jgi:hypothetical protein
MMEATVEQTHPLTDEERRTLFQCERAIKAANEGFYLAGSALRTIRDRALHRETHATFDAYCAGQFDISRSRACRLIGAADVLDRLRMLPIGNILPATESQIRPLFVFSTRVGCRRVLDLEEIGKVWAEVVAQAEVGPDGGTRITAKLVQEVVDHRRGAEKEPRCDEDQGIREAKHAIELAISKAIGGLPNKTHAYEAVAKHLRKLARQLESA